MKKKTILIIEDNLDVRENTAELLELGGYHVMTASNGKEGVAAAQQYNPDLIICDIMMPILDGYGVLHLLGKKPETARIPFIFLTAKSEKSDVRKGKELGADDYIVKPINDTELLISVEARLKKAENNIGTIDHMNFRLNQMQDRDVMWDDLLKDIADKHIRSVGKRDVIYSEGDTCQGVYIVLKGKVKVFKSHDLGKDLILRVRGKGEMMAYVSLLHGEIQLDNAVALEPSEVMFIPRNSFFNWLEEQPRMMLELIYLMSGALIFERERAVNLAYSSVRKRTSDALLKLKGRFHEGNSDALFTMPISRDDLAAMVGTATESVIRTLSDFKEEGLIKIQGSSITILNEERLRRMKN
jgi:CRP-like cAMP-binding protein/AmiR/NasT family two-component response regulator